LIIQSPSVFAGGAGAGFGDYGDFGVSEGARMGANPHYPGLIAGNISATSSTPRVMTPLPTVTPTKITPQSQANQNTSITNNSESNQTKNSFVLDNQTNLSNEGEICNMTAEPSIGELIRAGDWDAINAYQKNKRKAQSGFLGTTETNQDESDLAGYDDSVVTIVYPCS